MSSIASYAGISKVREFDDPFLLPSSQSMPRNLRTALDLCPFLYYMNPQYQSASSRVVRHFITDFDFPGDDASNSEKDQFSDFLHYQLGLPQFLGEVGDEWAVFGNVFVRIHFPFDRFLYDERNSREYSLDMFGLNMDYNWREMTYTVPDPANPGKHRSFPFRDRKSLDVGRIRLRKINPRYITIWHSMISGQSQFLYRFEEEIIQDVKHGRLFQVNEMPREMLAAISNEQDFLFERDTIFHFRAPTVSGISNYGWGMPPTIANFRNLHHIQVYRKIDEAVGHDYMLPFRLFSPPVQGHGGAGEMSSMVNTVDMKTWRRAVQEVIDTRRTDKFSMHSFPFPIQYQEFGAQGKALTPQENMEYQTNQLLDGMGYPKELWHGSLQYVQVPTALRLFENSFLFVHRNFNALTQWVVRRIRTYLNEPAMRVALQRPTMADSLERKQLQFQLASMGEISRETGWEHLGIDDVRGEHRKRLEEDAALQRQKMKQERELQVERERGIIEDTQAEAAAGGHAAGGAGTPPGGPPTGGGPAQTPLDIQSQAQQLAQQWLSIPEGERRQAMIAAEQTQPQLYAMAKTMMEKMRSQGESQGRQMVNQSFQGGQPR